MNVLVIPPEAPIIALSDVRRSYGEGDAEVHALAGISFEIHRGEFVMVMGASGSGKSTCMNILGCLDRPTSGSYRFLGVEVAGLDQDQRALLRRHYLGFVFQSFNLLARTSAVQNVELPLVYRGVSARERRRRAEHALAQVGLAARTEHTPAQLSGGQQQRVAIARALVSEPSVLFADEPTGNLDTQTSDEIMNLLVSLNRERGITIVMVTHEPELAEAASRVIMFRDGKVVADGRPEEVL